MQAVLTAFNRLLEHDEGQDLVEYGLLVVLIAIIAIAGITFLGQTASGVLWVPLAHAL